jgi:prevent-host-death family protein
MEIMNIHEARSQLSKLVERALEGEEVIIARAGKPMVRLVPVRDNRTPAKEGNGRVKLASPRTSMCPPFQAARFASKWPTTANDSSTAPVSQPPALKVAGNHRANVIPLVTRMPERTKKQRMP